MSATKPSASQGQDDHKLNILLTNGRFPVSLDLARQFRLAGHTVYCIDPMGTHICTFSKAVKQSAQVPAPHKNATGYIQAVKLLVARWHIDIIIPIHEEIFCLADSKEPEVLDRLFAPSFDLLVRLHNKHEFTNYMEQLGLAVPRAWLCKSLHDVMQFPVEEFPDGIALKPCFGRACSGLYYLKPGAPIPTDLQIDEDNWYVAQEWLEGKRYCSYSIVREGRIEATSCYPVLDTLDGSSSVFFRQTFHPGIYDYIHGFVTGGPKFSGQIAFDFIETSKGLYAIECNPRATSGLHLWTNTPSLAEAITGSLPKELIERPIRPPKKRSGRESHAQVAAGMLMWQHKDATTRVWLRHMKRLVFTRDVIWKWRDPMPTIAQPFLLTEYYRK